MKTMRMISVFNCMASAVLLTLAALMPDANAGPTKQAPPPPRPRQSPAAGTLAPKTKIAVPCPDCPVYVMQIQRNPRPWCWPVCVEGQG